MNTDQHTDAVFSSGSVNEMGGTSHRVPLLGNDLQEYTMREALSLIRL